MPRVSEERRAALRDFFEHMQACINPGAMAEQVGGVLEVLDDLDLAEKRERITAGALEDMLRECCNQSDTHRQAAAVISVRREREVWELQTACCCCGAPKGDDGPDRRGNVWCNDCAVGARMQYSKTRVLCDPPCPLHAPREGRP